MTSIRSCASELKSITNELKRLNAQKRKLMAKKKQVEAAIISFLEKNQQQGVKYQGTAIVAKDKKRRPRKKESEQRTDGLAVLSRYGVKNGEVILEEVMKAMKNEAVTQTALSVKKL